MSVGGPRSGSERGDLLTPLGPLPTAPEALYPAIGARLRAHRQRQGISLRQLARRVGMSPGGLSQLETGKSASIGSIRKVAGALDLSLDELFGIHVDRS